MIASGGPSDQLARRLFVALVGASFFFAFLSVGAQIEGLIGANGILPAAPYLTLVTQNLGADRFWRLPTIFYFGASDEALVGACVAGIALSAFVIAGRVERVALLLCWLLYLSISSAGRSFFAYQWDILLLEVALVAALVAPTDRATHPVAVWLGRVVLFKLMFSSGFAKLASGDEAWRGLGALFVHYETQPLPTPLAWFAHHLPLWFHRASVVGVFVIQLALPFGLFGPRRVRIAAALGLAFLQVLIALTGNYTFFNLLALALCFLAFDDRFLRGLLPANLAALRPPPVVAEKKRVTMALAIALLALDVVPLANLVFGRGALPAFLDPVFEKLDGFRSANGYGLFASMTVDRPEIIIEGSQDGVTWKPYELEAKPGALDRAPPFVAPHQPRLDWQLWFAALGGPRSNPWLSLLLDRMLEGSPQVLGLFAHDPFDGAPPKWVRARTFDYRFTTPDERAATGNWWRRTPTGTYFSARTLR